MPKGTASDADECAQSKGGNDMIPGKLGRYARSVSIIGIGATPFCDISEDPELKGLTEGEFFGQDRKSVV